MRLLLLICSILLVSFTIQGQTVKAKGISSTSASAKADLKIYPNPASNFIQLKVTAGVSAIIIYNLVGRKIKDFTPAKDKTYLIADLPKGMYLIQLLDFSGKVLTTQRLSKK